MCSARGDVRFVPKADIGQVLFDHLAGAREHSGWHGEAEGFCRLEVDRKLVLGRRLYRQLGWLTGDLVRQDIRRAAEKGNKLEPLHVPPENTPSAMPKA